MLWQGFAVVYVGKQFKWDNARLIWTDEVHQMGRNFTNSAHAILQTAWRLFWKLWPAWVRTVLGSVSAM